MRLGCLPRLSFILLLSSWRLIFMEVVPPMSPRTWLEVEANEAECSGGRRGTGGRGG